MTLELVAGRIIAPQVGVSLYTWTSVIGVILAGMSLGNYLGGRLADRYASLGLLGVMLLLGGLASLGVLVLARLPVLDLVAWPLIAEIFLLITLLFFVPAMILGTISPIVVKLAIPDMARAGRTVGRLSAAGTAGSILGTFATGFWLISWFGTHTVIWGVAAVLLVMGAFFLFADHRVAGKMALALVLLLSAGVVRLGLTQGPCLMETRYFCVKIQDDTRDGRPVRRLILDRLVHSYNSLEDPTHLVYHYEQTYAELTAYQATQVDVARPDPSLRTLFIGGGGYTFPRYVEAVYPESAIDVVEIDPGVTEVAYAFMGLARDSGIVTHNEDARLFLARTVSVKYDLIFGDAFDDFSVPYHLTTQEFNERVRAWLEHDGLYIVNVVDGGAAHFLRAYVRTLRLTFAHVYVVPNVPTWRTISRDTFIVVAADVPLDLSAFGRQSRLVGRVLSPSEVDVLLADGRPLILTDRYAPVEQLLAPVYLGRTD